MAKKSNPKHNIDKISPSKKSLQWTTFFSVNDMKENLINEDIVEKWAFELKEWADKQTTPVRLNRFLRPKGISYKEFAKLTDKFPALNEAYLYALEALGDIREAYSISGDGVAATLNNVMIQYCNEWYKAGENRAAWAKIDPNALQGDVKVIFERRTVVENANIKPEQITEKKEKDGESTNNPK